MEKMPLENSSEKIEKQIEALLEALSGFGQETHDELTPEMQEDWYFIEAEARSGQDRAQAEGRLREFVEYLQEHFPAQTD
ncbi:MAG: hypothetical protein Q8O87_01055 [bacterium]|nr:hypothetical protein [bacterium]